MRSRTAATSRSCKVVTGRFARAPTTASMAPMAGSRTRAPPFSALRQSSCSSSHAHVAMPTRSRLRSHPQRYPSRCTRASSMPSIKTSPPYTATWSCVVACWGSTRCAIGTSMCPSPRRMTGATASTRPATSCSGPWRPLARTIWASCAAPSMSAGMTCTRRRARRAARTPRADAG